MAVSMLTDNQAGNYPMYNEKCLPRLIGCEFIEPASPNIRDLRLRD
jgi:hypothetical protein